MTPEELAVKGRLIAETGRYAPKTSEDWIADDHTGNGYDNIPPADGIPGGVSPDSVAANDGPPDDDTPPSGSSSGDGCGGETSDHKQSRRSIAAQLVDLARDAYTLVVDEQGDAYGIDQARSHIALPLRGGKTGLRAELARRYFADHDIVPGQQALADACTVLDGYAAQENPVRIHLRVAQHVANVYIDVGDTACSVIRIGGGGWTLANAVPVLFRRTKLTGALPIHSNADDLSMLWEFVPIDEADRPVLLSFLVAALIQPDVPVPVLALLAEQGSAKSTITRCLVSLVDPSPVPLRKAPRDADGWVTAAAASRVVALDNLSGDIPAWLSDSLCRASTGDGDVRRALYTDSDVATFSFRRVVIFNGIDVTVGAGDLAERIAAIDLPRISPEQRRPEDELAQSWEQTRPHIFGALLALAAQVHYRLPAIEVAQLPRMADFAKVLAAVDEILGTNGLARYRERSTRVAADTIVDAFIVALRDSNYRAEAKSSAEIMAELTPDEPNWKRPRDWPKNPRAATNQLRRNAPALREQGWVVDDDCAHNKDKVTRWTIAPPEKVRDDAPPAPPNPPSQVNSYKSGGLTETCSPVAAALNPPGGAAGQAAGQGKIANPPHLPGLTCDDGAAGQAGQENSPSLVFSTNGSAPPGFTPPSGAGRCDECGYHIATQGHRSSCQQTNEKDFA